MTSRGLNRSEQWLAEHQAKRRKIDRAIDEHILQPLIEQVDKEMRALTIDKIVGCILVGLPYPPSVNTYWRNLGTRTILSKRARDYRKAILAAVGPAKPLLGRLSVVVNIFPPDKRRRDIDNCVKSLFDALQHAGVYRDDEQIDFFSVQRCAVQKGGGCTVNITEA